MTTAAAVPGRRPRSDADTAEAARLEALLDQEFLDGAGWDATTRTLTPPPDHPQFGYRVCVVVGCSTPSSRSDGFCATCAGRYRASGLEREVFIAGGTRKQRVMSVAEAACAVPGCARPQLLSRRGLCSGHCHHQDKLELPLAEFLAYPGTRPLPSLGTCRVLACSRLASTRRRLCHAHEQRWKKHLQANPAAMLGAWVNRAGPVSEGHRVSLGGLAPLVQAELLYGLQERCRRGTRTKLGTIRMLVRRLHAAQARSVLDLPLPTRRPYRRIEVQDALAIDVRTAVTRSQTTPEAERHKPVWDLGVFGHAGRTLDFTVISQGWLQAAAQEWAFEDLPRRRGRQPAGVVRGYVNHLGELSASLRQRPDHGEHPGALGRADIVAFLNRLAFLEAKGKLSTQRRCKLARQVAKILRDCRALGLTRPGQPMAGLPDDFAVRRDDIPPEPSREDPGRALPPAVLRQLRDALPALEATISFREVRVAVELLMDTGRRPEEVCALPWACLDRDRDGKAVLVYSDFKANRLGRRLPITDATAELLAEQQRQVQARFPATPVDQLVLLPRPTRNPRGTEPIRDHNVSEAHRRWVNSLRALRLDDGTEFARKAVVPYAYRHSYAQRHADAGTPVDVLRDLMGHRSAATTQGYYRITEKRTREAVDKLVAYQFNGRGERIWRQAERLLDHEHQRLRVGQVAVPFGTCSEPSNVKAGGGACPFRFRCAGCAHFRTDPSYLPELRGYLERLLADRERVRAAVELDDWARAEAMPSEAEIGRIRALIRKIEQTVDDLDDDERRLIDQATATLRATRRTVHLGMPTIGPPTPDLRLEAPA